MVPQPFEADGQIPSTVQGQVVDPGDLAAAGLEAGGRLGVDEVGLLVAVLADLDVGLPVRGQLQAKAAAQVLLQVVGVVVVAGGEAVVLVVPLGPEQVQRKFAAAVEAVGETAADRVVGVAVAIRVVADGGVVTGGVEARDPERHAGRPAPRGEARLEPEAVVRAGLDSAVQGRTLFAAPSEYLDHAADGLGTVEVGARAANQLDALHLAEWQVLPGEGPQGGGAGPHAVDHHHHLSRVGAPKEEAGRLAVAALVGEIDAREPPQQFHQALRLAALDGGAVDHLERGEGLPVLLDETFRGDVDALQGLDALGGERGADEQRGEGASPSSG